MLDLSNTLLWDFKLKKIAENLRWEVTTVPMSMADVMVYFGPPLQIRQNGSCSQLLVSLVILFCSNKLKDRL